MEKVNTDQPSTSKVHDYNRVIVEDSQTDSDNDEEEFPIKTTIPRVVVDQVYEEIEKFKKVMKEKAPHYLESNSVVYPNFKCTDDVVFTNYVFVNTGNGDKVNPEINKIVIEDNKEVSKEAFFSNQSKVENTLNKNSSTFQRKKPKQNWKVKQKT